MVCCYPDGVALTAAAGRLARRHLVLSYSRDVWWMDVNAWANAVYARLRRSDRRLVVHPPSQIRSAAASAGLRTVHEEHGLVDHLTVFSR